MNNFFSLQTLTRNTKPLGEAKPGEFWEVYAKRYKYSLGIENSTRVAMPSAAAAMQRPR